MQSKLILPTGTRTTEPEEGSTVVPFLSAVPGGKDPTNNWLKNDIAEGQTFVSRRRTPPNHVAQLILDEWTLVNNRTTTYLLLTNLNQEAYVRVLPAEFSRDMELVEVLE